MNNTQFTEEQRTEAYRVESMHQMMRQTKAVETVRTYVAIWFWLSVIGAVLAVIAVASASTS
jgi:hypothetical protein